MQINDNKGAENDRPLNSEPSPHQVLTDDQIEILVKKKISKILDERCHTEVVDLITMIVREIDCERMDIVIDKVVKKFDKDKQIDVCDNLSDEIQIDEIL